MSKASDPLPLPQPSQILKERADLLTAWDGINDWYAEAVSPSGLYRGDGFRHYAGPILLALKYLILELKQWVKDLSHDNLEARQGLARAVKAVMAALPWAQKQPGVDALIAEFQNSLVMTIFTAKVDYDCLYPVELHWITGLSVQQIDLPGAYGHLRRCLAMWKLVQFYITKYPDTKVATMKVVKSRVNLLEKQMKVQLPDVVQPSTKRSGEEVSSAQKSKRPTRRQSPSTPSMKEVIMARFTVSPEDRITYLNKYDRSIGMVPLEGRTKSPVPITVENVKTIYGGSWLDDAIIDGYLSLVCHKANGHFESGPLPQSPNWHAWSCHWLSNDPRGESWPPPAYPDAQVQNIGHHFFPRHRVNHWVLFHLYRDDQGKSWQAEFMSSQRGYEDAIQDDWPNMMAALSSLSDDLNLSGIEVEIPKDQPMQRNSNDCGVLLLCAARWICEGWPLSSIGAESCLEIRERMIVELEKWRLD